MLALGIVLAILGSAGEGGSISGQASPGWPGLPGYSVGEVIAIVFLAAIQIGGTVGRRTETCRRQGGLFD